MKRQWTTAEIAWFILIGATRPYCQTDYQNWDGWTRKQNGEDWRSDCYLPERLLCQPAFSALEEMVSTRPDYELPAGIWGN